MSNQNMSKLRAKNDQGLSKILEEDQDSLNNFIQDKANCDDIRVVKAFICYSLSNYHTLIAETEIDNK